MKQARNWLVLILALVTGFVAGVVVVNLFPNVIVSPYSTSAAVASLRSGELAVGTSMSGADLPESRAFHQRPGSDGQTVVTAIYQDRDYVLLLEAVDDKIQEATLWRTDGGSPELHLVRSSAR